MGAFLGACMGDWPGQVSGEIPGTPPGAFPGKSEPVMGSRVKLGVKTLVSGAKSCLALGHSWRHLGESASVNPGEIAAKLSMDSQ